jgi:carbon storage regulator
MLVISRKKNESIIINDNIYITVVEVRGDKVRLGIVLPREVPVHRQEVFDAIHGFSPHEPIPAPHATWESAQSIRQITFVEISVKQLVNELGATDADVPTKVRFTNEGGIPT